MTYDTPQALRMALEQRLLTRSNETGIGLDRLRPPPMAPGAAEG